MNDLTTLIKSRRSANRFIEGIDIPDRTLDDIFNEVKYAPSAFNLQHARYVVVKAPDLKDKVYEAANKQHKIRTASAVIVVLGNMRAYEEVGRMNEGFLSLGIIDKLEYDQTVEEVTRFYKERGESFMRDEAIRNASLSAMMLMLVAKDKGWDTCPMIGFDPELLRKALGIPAEYVPAMLIAIGKEDAAKPRPRGYRKPVLEFVSYDRF
ncbi:MULTISPECIES: nitroreductase family protein [Paenibacillus]|jgi:putative NAD(P)H nitroreductase|uniref:Nitroreductase n=2 Tax=Paenibacillus lactis TaxID=228574 RepID=G4HHG1_9BACL|nr:nitroreductase family protein [Paenibacillus lactis]EHB63537.1 nitroreductase [Paenibacillus lactis 154]MBP1891818.1 putative NAD(P)H nitroreductase [Paenibacillus lactis]MCM3494275.1 nitroreductase family protein [Paenibacillus lactis]HAF99263.1 nitroreductase family protein [Paenibacillus lactis]